MSFDARQWAYKQTGLKSATKFVLVTMGDRVNDECYFFESLTNLEGWTALNIKTIRKAVGELIDLGLIKDTGEYCGHSGQIKVYKLVGVPRTHFERKQAHDYDAEQGTNFGRV